MLSINSGSEELGSGSSRFQGIEYRLFQSSGFGSEALASDLKAAEGKHPHSRILNTICRSSFSVHEPGYTFMHMHDKPCPVSYIPNLHSRPQTLTAEEAYADPRTDPSTYPMST